MVCCHRGLRKNQNWILIEGRKEGNQCFHSGFCSWLPLNAAFLFLQHVCCDCKKDFCSVCSVLQENLRRCSTCHLLQETAFQRPQLMRLKVKDLRQYLILRNIPIDTCREKEDLVDLVLCHHGLGSEDDLDTSSLNSSRSQSSSFFTHSFFSNYTAPSATVSSFQGELMGRDRTLGSGVLAQVWGANYPGAGMSTVGHIWWSL